MDIKIKIFITLFIAYAFFTNFYLTTNDAPRFSLTAAIVEEQRFEIDSFLNKSIVLPSWYPKGLLIWGAIDFAEYNGHIYSDKAPLGSFLAIPIYSTVRLFTSDIGILAYFCSLFVSGLLTTLTAVLIYDIGRYFTKNDDMRLLVALGYGLGTMAFFYGTIFFSHATTTFFGFIAFYLLFKVKRKDLGDNSMIMAGIFAAFTTMSDYYALITVLGLFVYCLSFCKKTQILKFLGGFSIAISLLLIYHYIIFDDPFTPPYKYVVTFKAEQEQGFYGVTVPKLDAIIGLTISPYRGLFFYNPLLLLSVLYLPMLYRRHKTETMLIFFICIGFFFFNASYSVWGGGICVGPRHLLPVIPFLMLPLFVIDTNRGKKWFKRFLLVSLLINFVYVQSRMNLVAIDMGVLTIDLPIISDISNALNQLLLSYGFGLPSYSSILIIVILSMLWFREIPKKINDG